MAYLADAHELFDPGGMGSTRLPAAVGFPGSSMAFAQLLSGMERASPASPRDAADLADAR